MGSGFKDWAAGDVLTAADVDGYLMRQTVMTFADASARDTALSGVLDEGMVTYLEDTNALTVYNGSAWVAVIDSDVLTVDTSNNRVGINDSTPSYALDVTGDINSSADLRIGGTAIGKYTDYSGSITYNNLTLGNGSHESYYARVGNFVHFYGYIVFGSTTSVTGAVQWSLPITAYSSAPLHPNNVMIENIGTALIDGACFMASTTVVGAFAKYAGSTYVEWQAVSPTIPVGTWAANDKIVYDLVYRAA